MEKKSTEQLLFANALLRHYKVLGFVLLPCARAVHPGYPSVTLSTSTPAPSARGHPKDLTHLFPCVLMKRFQAPKPS